MIPKSVSASSAQEHENKVDGMRTERITLEVTGAPGWRVHVLGVDVESVRVVEQARNLTLGEGLCAAQAASGSGKPVAWMCEWTDHTDLYGSEAQAKRAAGCDIVPQPLYRQPPGPEGDGNG
jgi:hypothetical protein